MNETLELLPCAAEGPRGLRVTRNLGLARQREQRFWAAWLSTAQAALKRASVVSCHRRWLQRCLDEMQSPLRPEAMAPWWADFLSRQSKPLYTHEREDCLAVASALRRWSRAWRCVALHEIHEVSQWSKTR
jgi:hypothetical protein